MVALLLLESRNRALGAVKEDCSGQMRRPLLLVATCEGEHWGRSFYIYPRGLNRLMNPGFDDEIGKNPRSSSSFHFWMKKEKNDTNNI